MSINLTTLVEQMVEEQRISQRNIDASFQLGQQNILEIENLIKELKETRRK